ncbi:MAG: hypothetical protein ACAI34_20735 [Verrucomicrobium sp.]|nr:hypothetical protein [Verrucomicrobium sp.]
MKSKATTGRGQQPPAEVPMMAGDLSGDLTAEKPRDKGGRRKAQSKGRAKREPKFEDRETEQQDKAQEKREGIFAGSYQWQGSDLIMSSGRETLYRIVRHYWPTPPPVVRGEDETITDDEVLAYLPSAWVLLYLCSHTEDAWRSWQSDRLRWIAEVESWAEENVPLELQGDAIDLAFKMQRDVREMIAVARRRGGASRAGK